MPIASATTANIGTPRTKAANMRWTSAAIHTAARAPMTGNSPYAWLVSATACSATTRSGVIRSQSAVVRAEKRLALGEVDRQRRAYLRQELRRHFAPPLAAGPCFHPLHHHAAHERGDPRHPLPRGGAPREHRAELGPIRHGPARGDHRPPRGRLVGARRIGGEHIARERVRARAAAATQPAILARAAPAPERPPPQAPEQGPPPPDLGEAP